MTISCNGEKSVYVYGNSQIQSQLCVAMYKGICYRTNTTEHVYMYA